MHVPLLISVDLGSSAVKTSLVDSAGHILAATSRPTAFHQPRPGVVEQDPDDFVAATLDTMRVVMEKSGARPASIAAIALDGQMSGCMGVDRTGQAVTPWTSTLDTRFTPYLDRFVAECEAAIRRLNGSCQPCYGPKIAWFMNEYPDVARRIERFVILGGYVAARLAGLPVDHSFMDTTYLCITGIADIEHGEWSPQLCAPLDIPMSKLPRIVASTDVIGTLTPENARRGGLLEGTPIVAGLGDQPAGFLGAGLVETGMLVDVAGTYPVMALCTDTFMPDTDGRTVEIWPSAIPGRWHPMTLMIGGGLTHRWFVDLCGVSADPAGHGAAGYEELDHAASLLGPGSARLLFLPHLGGRACPPDTAMRGGWLGLNWGHRKEHLYRSILESIAYDYALSVKALRRLYPEWIPSRVRVIGGGAQSDLWDQIKADVLGLTYDRLHPDESTALGTALVAGRAVDLFSDLAASAKRWSQVVSSIEPDVQHHQQYQEFVQLYQHALAGTGPVFRELSGLPFNP